MTDNTEALPPLPAHPTARTSPGDSGWTAAEKRVIQEYALSALAQRQQVPDANEWRSLLIGWFVQKWSGNDLVKAGDVLDWIMDQPLAAAPALTAAPSAQAEPRHSTTWSGDCPHWCKACATERAERAVTQTEDLWS